MSQFNQNLNPLGATKPIDQEQSKRISHPLSREINETFFVKDVHYSKIDWGVSGLPKYLDTHPDDNRIRARDLRAIEHPEKVGSIVRISFRSSDQASRGIRLPEPDPLDSVTPVLRESRLHTESIMLPYVFIIMSAKPDPNDPTVSIWGREWVWEWREYFNHAPTIEIEWKINNMGWNNVRRIYDLQDQVHRLPDGNLYRFTVQNISQLSRTEWSATVAWIGDNGTPNIFASPRILTRGSFHPMLPGDMRNFAGPGGALYLQGHEPPPNLCRSPFHSIDIIFEPKDPSAPAPPPLNPDPPILIQREQYAVNPSLFNAWQSLPQFPVNKF